MVKFDDRIIFCLSSSVSSLGATLRVISTVERSLNLFSKMPGEEESAAAPSEYEFFGKNRLISTDPVLEPPLVAVESLIVNGRSSVSGGVIDTELVDVKLDVSPDPVDDVSDNV